MAKVFNQWDKEVFYLLKRINKVWEICGKYNWQFLYQIMHAECDRDNKEFEGDEWVAREYE